VFGLAEGSVLGSLRIGPVRQLCIAADSLNKCTVVLCNGDRLQRVVLVNELGGAPCGTPTHLVSSRFLFSPPPLPGPSAHF
jgi:hypothetical protein